PPMLMFTTLIDASGENGCGRPFTSTRTLLTSAVPLSWTVIWSLALPRLRPHPSRGRGHYPPGQPARDPRGPRRGRDPRHHPEGPPVVPLDRPPALCAGSSPVGPGDHRRGPGLPGGAGRGREPPPRPDPRRRRWPGPPPGRPRALAPVPRRPPRDRRGPPRAGAVPGPGAAPPRRRPPRDGRRHGGRRPAPPPPLPQPDPHPAR